MNSNTPASGWVMTASSEFSGAYSAYKATQQDSTSELATLGKTTNFYIGVKMPSYLSPIEPYGFSVRGRSTSEYIL